MDNLFATTWWEDLLIVGFLILFCWSVGLFLFALIATVLSSMGRYSLNAVLLYWSVLILSFLLVVLRASAGGILFFIFSTPVTAVGMHLLERNRKRKIRAVNVQHAPQFVLTPNADVHETQN